MKSRRIIGLDVFRIMAALFVFLFHSQTHIGCSYGILNGFIRMGAVFMTGFFMLSGFALFASYQDKPLMEKSHWKSFYLKRLIGIVPIYYVITIVHTLFLAWEAPFYRILLLPIEILGLQSVFSSLFPFSHNGGTWFISCLILCYLIFPYLQELIKQISPPRGQIILLVLCTFVLFYAPLIVHHLGTASIYTNPFFRLLEFLIGILLAAIRDLIFKSPKCKWLLRWPAFYFEFLVLILAVSLAVKLNIGVDNYMLYSWIGLPIFALMLLTLSSLHSPKLQHSKVLKYLSNISYVFFLAQFFTWESTEWVMGVLHFQNNLLKIIISFLICMLLSVLLHELIEKPITRLLKCRLAKYL